jgi:hypothetical protein
MKWPWRGEVGEPAPLTRSEWTNALAAHRVYIQAADRLHNDMVLILERLDAILEETKKHG